MGYLKDIANQPRTQTFPGAQFEASGTIPAPQCTKAVIEGDHGITIVGGGDLTDVGAFAGFNLVGKTLVILAPPAGVDTHILIFNNDDIVEIVGLFNHTSNDNVYYIHDGGALETTRTAQTLMDFVLASGYAATMKGGKLYTDMPSAELALACRILFDPLT